MFVSAALTAFVLAALAAVVYAYQGMTTTQPISQPSQNSQAAPAPASFVSSNNIAMAAPVQEVSPQDAAALAAKQMNRTDLYSVQLTQYQGVAAYKVSFTSGDVVYVDMTGQVLGSVAAAPTSPATVYSFPAKKAGTYAPKTTHSKPGGSGGGDDGGGGGDN